MANQSFPTKTTNMSKPKVTTKATTKSTATQSFPQPIAKQTYANAPQYTPAVGVGAKSNGYTYTNQGWVSSTAPSALTKTSTPTTSIKKTSGTPSGGGSSGSINDMVTSSTSNLRTNTNISSPAAGTTINSTGGGSTLSSVINTNTLAGNNQKMDLTGTNPDEYVKDSSAFAITVPQEESALQKQQKESDSILQKMMDSLGDVPDTAAIDRKLRNQLQIEQKQQAVNDLTGQLNAIVNKGQAQQLAQVGQGRGIPEAIIGGIQAQIGRETAIAALPVQAQLQAAQGNLEMANDSLDRLFKIYSDDATNRYNAKNKMFEVAYGIADKKEQRLLDEQKIENERAYQEKIKKIDAINAITKEAVSFGMTASAVDKMANAETVLEAINIASPYLAKANRELKSVGDNFYMWDKNTNKLTKVGGISNGTSGTVSNPAYAGIVNTILGSGKFTKDQSAAVANAINNGEDPLAVIKNNAKGIMTSTEATKLGSFETAKGALIDLDTALKDYYAAGGKTNIFKGNFEKTINKLGEVSDPNLVEISTRIQAVLQVYRNAVSGTAYSVQESKDIDSIFPGITKSEGLNTAILNGRKKAFDATIDTTYGNVLGQDTYKKLKDLEITKNNIPKGTLDDRSYVEKVLVSKNIKYDDFVNQTPPNGQIPVIDNSTGEIGYIPYVEFNSSKYTKI